jgi:hypothetical protein
MPLIVRKVERSACHRADLEKQANSGEAPPVGLQFLQRRMPDRYAGNEHAREWERPVSQRLSDEKFRISSDGAGTRAC